MNKNLLYLFLLVFLGCSKGEKKSPNVFFAGEVVNPTDDYVVLYKGEVIIDSARLDENNRFSFNLDTIADGLYHFNHAPEYQYVYLEEGDSLMVRLNTVDFDESLVFSGIGEEVNNFLLELFVANEEEERSVVYPSFSLDSEEFSGKIDSLQNEKLNSLNELLLETQLSNKAHEIAKASINYRYYTYKEEYPFKHRNYTKKKTIEELPKSFYDYRKNLNYGNNDLTYLIPYYDFMVYHFGNLSYMTCSHECDIEGKVVKNQLHFNRHKLKLIDSMVTDQELKDNLFRNVAFYYLLKSRDSEDNNRVFINEFHKFSGNNRHIEEIDDLYEGINNIQPSKKIPDVFVSNVSGDSISLQQISKGKRTVFYFWSGADRKHFESMVDRVAYLSSNKPEYDFVGINIKTDEANWKGLIESANLDKDNQYRSSDFEQLTRTLIVYPLNKCIITNDAVIIDAFGDIYASSF